MRRLRIALLASCALVVGAALYSSRAPLIDEAAAQTMNEFGGDRVAPLGFCVLGPTAATINLTSGSTCFGTSGVFAGNAINIAGGTGGVNAVIGTSFGLPTQARYAQICATAPAYYRDDGTLAVGTTGGMPLAVGGAPNCLWYAGNMSAFSVIQATGSVYVSFYH